MQKADAEPDGSHSCGYGFEERPAGEAIKTDSFASEEPDEICPF
jgi:hypothetical protein